MFIVQSREWRRFRARRFIQMRSDYPSTALHFMSRRLPVVAALSIAPVHSMCARMDFVFRCIGNIVSHSKTSFIFFFVTLRTDNENKTHKKQIMKTHEKWPTMKRRSQKRWCFRLFHISALRDQTLAAMTHATLYVRHDDDRPESLVFTFFGI